MNNTPRLRTVLVDDEVLARLALRQALANHPEVEIVGECGNAAEAMQAVRVLRPDLLFLDIQMPGIDGFELLHELTPDRLPLWYSPPPSPNTRCARSMRWRWTTCSSRSSRRVSTRRWRG